LPSEIYIDETVVESAAPLLSKTSRSADNLLSLRRHTLGRLGAAQPQLPNGMLVLSRATTASLDSAPPDLTRLLVSSQLIAMLYLRVS